MNQLKYLLFNVICFFSFSIVFAANEVVIKSITPIYDEGSSVIVSNENVTFNEKDQNVKYKVVIENTTENELKVSNIDLTKPSVSYLIYEIEDIAKDDILKSKETKEIVISLTTTEKDKDASDFEQELLTTISFERNVENPYTSTKELMIVLVLTTFVVLTGMLLLCKNNKISRYVAIFVVCFGVIPVIKADSTIDLQIKLNIKYETQKLIEVLSGDGTKAGDELRIGKEHFYVISNDGTNITLLAKYNLEVGSNCVYNGDYTCTEIENPTGLQSEKALGYTSSGYNTNGNYGVVPFSSTIYWYSSGLKSEYGTSYPAYVYDDNASIKNYVDNYAEYLEELGLTIEEARLIKQEELVGLGCKAGNLTCTTSQYDWVYATSYWSGSARANRDVWRVLSNGGFVSDFYSSSSASGVRPVIVISSSEI